MRESLRFLSEESKEDESFPESGEGLPLSDQNIHSFQPRVGKVGYVDGGSAILLQSASLLLEKVRVVGTVFDHGKRALFKKEEYEVTIKLAGSNWVVSCTPNHEVSKHSISIHEASLREGSRQVSIEKVGHLIRRLMELEFMARFAKEKAAEWYVLDGSLEGHTPLEQEYLKELESLSCIGLSKTSRSLTKNGRDLSSSLLRKKSGTWFYHPVRIGNEKWDTSFVKLHENSVYVFRLDFWKKDSLAELTAVLAGESHDPVFIGYPYGLIVTDQWARVQNEEKDFWQLQLMVESGKHWERIAESLHSLDAHSLLDKIR